VLLSLACQSLAFHVAVLQSCGCAVSAISLRCCCCTTAGRKGGDDGAESAGMNTDAAGATPEPGTTPEPDDKGDALAALLAAGEQDMSEPEPENEGRGKSKGKRSRPGSEEQRGEEDEQVGRGDK
jgi:hypothetical protein